MGKKKKKKKSRLVGFPWGSHMGERPTWQMSSPRLRPGGLAKIQSSGKPFTRKSQPKIISENESFLLSMTSPPSNTNIFSVDTQETYPRLLLQRMMMMKVFLGI